MLKRICRAVKRARAWGAWPGHLGNPSTIRPSTIQPSTIRHQPSPIAPSPINPTRSAAKTSGRHTKGPNSRCNSARGREEKRRETVQRFRPPSAARAPIDAPSLPADPPQEKKNSDGSGRRGFQPPTPPPPPLLLPLSPRQTRRDHIRPWQQRQGGKGKAEMVRGSRAVRVRCVLVFVSVSLGLPSGP